jgi:hypothetical protein
MDRVAGAGEMVGLLDADPELGALLSGARLERAEAELLVDAVWSVLSPLLAVVLDRRLAEEVARYPEVLAALFDRLSDRSIRLGTTQAISQLTGVDRRLKALFWPLAERWAVCRLTGPSCLSLSGTGCLPN